LLVSGTLRNISGTPSVDCKFDVYHCGESLGNAIHEISDVTLHSGLGSGEKVDLSKIITLDNIDTHGSAYFSVGIAGLFSIGGGQPGSEYPFFVVFSYKNILGEPFFSAYSMKMLGHPGKAIPSMVFKGSHEGIFPVDCAAAHVLLNSKVSGTVFRIFLNGSKR
jgi:hypothetical protein